MNRAKRSFTLLELILVVVLIGVMAGVGIPSYQKAIEKNEERVALAKLQAIVGGMKIYKAKHGSYPAFDMPDLTSINQNLQLNIVPDKMTYTALQEQAPGDGDIPECRIISPYGWAIHWHELGLGGNTIHCSTAGVGLPCPSCPFFPGTCG